MHDFRRRTGWSFPLSRLAAFCLALLFLLSAPAAAAETEPDEAEEAAVWTAVETILRSYEEAAMLYVDRDLRLGTVAGPSVLLPVETEGEESRSIRVFGKDMTLAQLPGNIIFLEKKAAFYAAMRQMQGIYREDLHLTYRMEGLELTEDTARVSVRETAQFRYTDSDRQSVYEAFFTVYLIKLEGRWLIAGVTDGSRFDKLYRDQGEAFDLDAALAEFSARLEEENCRVAFPGTPCDSPGRIPYSGASAAAYAYTYSRMSAGTPRSGFYNTLFTGYAGEGGDCMNFASQCMWAGFGGSESAIGELGLPMDTAGNSQWFGRAAGGGKINHAWISCQSFRQYLTGNKEGTGSGGSNAAVDTGIYATILDVGAGCGFSGVAADELLGAVAHVEGSGGAYSHAIVFTDVTGTRRSDVWFCGHTKDITHLKLGDYYIGPLKVYIPRYLRAGEMAGEDIRTERSRPVEAGGTAILSARMNTVQEQMTITVTPPGGAAEPVVSVDDADNCWTEYTFSIPGLYRVDCSARAPGGGRTATSTCYIRCWSPEDLLPEEASRPEETGESEMPGWLRQPEDAAASGVNKK